jgi:hypothetical protein
MAKLSLYAVEQAKTSRMQCPPHTSVWLTSPQSHETARGFLSYKAPAISKRPMSPCPLMRLCPLMAATAMVLMTGIARADEPKPIQAQRLDLGSVAGIAYYTVEADGFHVVATLAQDGKDRVPLRVQGVLNAGQSLKFSTPGVIGVEPATITLERQGEKLVVRSNHQ